MKRKNIIKLKKRAKSWLGLVVYRIAQGSSNISPFAGWLAEIYENLITNIDMETVKDCIPEVNSSELKTLSHNIPHSGRFKNRVRQNLDILSHPAVMRQLGIDNNENTTIGHLIIQWATLTDQDANSFLQRIQPQMEALVLKWQQETGCSGLTDREIFSYPEKASEFLSEFYAILIEETPEEKLGSWFENIIDNLRRVALSKPRLLINNETLIGAATIMTSQVEKQISSALSVNPLARERVLSPEYGVLAELEAKKVGWENNYEKAFNMLTKHLQNEPGTQGLNDDKDSSSFAVRQVGRTNILTNLIEALEDRLHVRFLVAVRKFWECVRNKVKSSWEFSPLSPKDTAETEKSVREWLFRRKNNDTDRNH